MSYRHKHFPLCWEEKLSQNHELVILYSTFLQEVETFEDRLNLVEEIYRLGKQIDFILNMTITKFINRKDFFTVKQTSQWENIN